jgi:hypothetical protein
MSSEDTDLMYESAEFCAGLDDVTMNCECCGWWVDTDEMENTGLGMYCHDCYEQYEEDGLDA